MGRLSDLTDAGRQLVPYLDWSSPRISLVILQLLTLALVALFIAGPFIPWRFVFLAAGLAGLTASHPLSISILSHSQPHLQKRFLEFAARAEGAMVDDTLTDDHLDLSAEQLRLIEVLERETKVDGQWISLEMTDGKTSIDVTEPGQQIKPPEGFVWLKGEGWRIDKVGDGLGTMDLRTSSA